MNNYDIIIKKMYLECNSNIEELSKLIDKYLIPQELEKNSNNIIL